MTKLKIKKAIDTKKVQLNEKLILKIINFVQNQFNLKIKLSKQTKLNLKWVVLEKEFKKAINQ